MKQFFFVLQCDIYKIDYGLIILPIGIPFLKKRKPGILELFCCKGGGCRIQHFNISRKEMHRNLLILIREVCHEIITYE